MTIADCFPTLTFLVVNPVTFIGFKWCVGKTSRFRTTAESVPWNVMKDFTKDFCQETVFMWILITNSWWLPSGSVASVTVVSAMLTDELPRHRTRAWCAPAAISMTLTFFPSLLGSVRGVSGWTISLWTTFQVWRTIPHSPLGFKKLKNGNARDKAHMEYGSDMHTF